MTRELADLPHSDPVHLHYETDYAAPTSELDSELLSPVKRANTALPALSKSHNTASQLLTNGSHKRISAATFLKQRELFRGPISLDLSASYLSRFVCTNVINMDAVQDDPAPPFSCAFNRNANNSPMLLSGTESGLVTIVEPHYDRMRETSAFFTLYTC
jgi:hypothetical protein